MATGSTHVHLDMITPDSAIALVVGHGHQARLGREGDKWYAEDVDDEHCLTRSTRHTALRAWLRHRGHDPATATVETTKEHEEP